MSESLADESALTDRWLRWLDHHRHWCFLGLGLLYAAAFNGQWRMGSDSAIYMSLGRNLAEGLGYTYDGGFNRVMYPGLPWLLAALFRIGVADSALAPTVVMLLLSAAALALTYRLFILHADRPTAVCVTCLTGIAYTFFRFGFEILSDGLFCVGVLGVLAGYEGLLKQPRTGRQPTRDRSIGVLNWLLFSIGLLVAVTTRPTMWVLCAALTLTSVVRLIAGKQKTIHGTILTLMVLGVTGFLLLDPRRSAAGGAASTVLPGYEQWAMSQLKQFGLLWHTVVMINIPKFFEPHFTEAVFAIELGPGLNTVAAVILLVLGASLYRRRLLWSVWFVLMIAAMLFSEPAVRYTLPLIPLLAYAWWRAMVELEHRWPKRRIRQCIVLMLVLWCLPNVVRIGDFILGQRRTPFLQHYKNGRYAQLVDLAAGISNSVDHNATIISDYSHELGYLTRRPVMHTSEALNALNRPTTPLIKLLTARRTVLFVAMNDKRSKTAAAGLGVLLAETLLSTSPPTPPAAVRRLKLP